MCMGAMLCLVQQLGHLNLAEAEQWMLSPSPPALVTDVTTLP